MSPVLNYLIMDRFDPAFTRKLRDWLNDENRDYAHGALLIFRMRANHNEFRKLNADLIKYQKYIFDTIKKFYDFRAAEISHETVKKKVDKAVKIAKESENDSALTSVSSGIRSGKRADHDKLPQDIQQCYVDNLDLMRRISDAHTKIRLIISSNAACKDADLLPFADLIVKLDKKRLANWKKYDSFVIEPNQ